MLRDLVSPTINVDGALEMVLAITAFLMSAFGASAAADTRGDRLSEIFVAACLDGKVTLSRGEADPVGVDELPTSLRERLGRPASGAAWRLKAPREAYLYVLDNSPRPGVDPKICGVASERMSLTAAADALEMRIAGDVYGKRLPGMQWLMPQDGYVAIVTKAGKFNVVQINWLSEADRAAALNDVRRVTP